MSEAKVSSRGFMPDATIVETGTFPLDADKLEIIESIPDADEIADYLSTGVGFRASMDRNGDGIVAVADIVFAINEDG